MIAIHSRDEYVHSSSLLGGTATGYVVMVLDYCVVNYGYFLNNSETQQYSSTMFTKRS